MVEGKTKSTANLPFTVLLICMVVAIVLLAGSGTPDTELSNISNGKSEKIRLEIADDDFSRMRGLMFRPKTVPILFVFDSEDIHPIHSNFVKQEFDAVYLSEGKGVMEIFRKIPPNTKLVTPTKKASFLLELPCEMTDRLGIKVGDKLSWEKG